jgi:alpha-tubulin suppressor-like RCC1 family protein
MRPYGTLPFLGAVESKVGCRAAEGYTVLNIAARLGVSESTVVVGDEHSCALKGNGEVRCWGWRNRGACVPESRATDKRIESRAVLTGDGSLD